MKFTYSLIFGIFISFGGNAQVAVEHVEERVQSFGLDSIRTKNVLIYFDSKDSLRAREFADLSVSMAEFYEQAIGVNFDFKVAILQPQHWFSEFPGIPYAIPWPFFSDRIIMMPSSLTEGIMIDNKLNRQKNRWIVDFVLVHEYGHLLDKDYFRPFDENDYFGVGWFRELIANYFAYAYIHSTDSDWTVGAKELWGAKLLDYEPKEFTLNWSFMNDLAPQELGPTYAWYQFMLNLKAAELYEKHGVEFLRTLKSRLDWQDNKNWNTESLLPILDSISPGFIKWSENIENYAKKTDN